MLYFSGSSWMIRSSLSSLSAPSAMAERWFWSLAIFSIQNQEEETMGLNFRKELTLGEVQVGDPLAFKHIRILKAVFIQIDPPDSWQLKCSFPQIFPSPSNQPAPTRLQVICPHNQHQHRYQDEPNHNQERLLSKLGKDAFPFHLDFPPHSPPFIKKDATQVPHNTMFEFNSRYYFFLIRYNSKH